MGYKIPRLGWLPDPLDPRDLTVREPEVKRTLEAIMPRLTPSGAAGAGVAASPVGALRVDLRKWCSAVEDQGHVGSCTANAVAGAYEYFQRRTTGEYVDASRFFLYRATRRLLGWEGRGDTGAFIRSTIRALRLFGVPPEEYWPYKESDFDREPEAFQYAFAQNFRAIQYFRLQEVISQLKSALDSGLPFAFGFTCFSSMFTPEVSKSGIISYPTPQENVEGGHAVLAVGYTDSHVLIRNSWSENWGMAGYGFLPWTYFDRNRPLATDCWALVNAAIVPPEEVAMERPSAMGVARARVSNGDGRQQRREQPLIQVVRGSDPLAELPTRITPEGVRRVHDALRLGLRSTSGSALVELRGVSIKPSFDFTLLGQASNELYLIGLAWDLSARPPRVLPSADPSATEQLRGVFRQDGAAGGEIRFGDGGLRVWQDEPVVGALYLRLLLVESDKGAGEMATALRGVQDLVKRSDLAATLASLDSESAAEPLTRTEAEVSALMGEVTASLGKYGSVIPLFEGAYGADTLLRGRTDVYDQLGAVVELKVALEGEARVAATPGLTALKRMQLAMADERGPSRGVEAAPDATLGRKEEAAASKRPTGPRA